MTTGVETRLWGRGGHVEPGCDAVHLAQRAAPFLGRQGGGHFPHGPQGEL